MPITLAQAALKYAKSATTNGPNNIGSGQLSAPKSYTPKRDPGERMAASASIMHLKTMAPAKGCAMKDVLDYGRQVAKSGAGNCLEQCAAAAVYLSGQNVPSFHLVSLAPPADHVFVVIGQDPAGGKFPDDFSAWNADAIIVDPWVGICVKAQNYPEVWKMKLEVMGAVGQEMSAASGWKKADDAYWKTAPLAHAKECFAA